MLYALVFDMPMKTGLKLMTPVSSDTADPERKLLYQVVYELDSTILILPWKDLERPNASRIIDG